MVKKLMALAAVLLVAMAGPAVAGDGYTDEDALVLSDTTVAPGGTFTASVEVCEPGTTASFAIDGQAAATATVNQSGIASASLTAPTAPGTYTVSGSCTGADGGTLVLSSTLTVSGAATGGGDLPTTGSSSTMSMTQVGLAVLVVGGLLVLLANKRRTAKSGRELTTGV